MESPGASPAPRRLASSSGSTLSRFESTQMMANSTRGTKRLYKEMEEVAEASAMDQVELGDFIIVGMIDSSGKLDGVIDGDGHFMETVQPVEDDKAEHRRIFDSIFRVAPVLQFDAQREYARFREGIRGKPIKGKDDRVLDKDDKVLEKEMHMFRAQAARDEMDKNRSKMDKLLLGKLKDVEVLYGYEIQLQHVASGKFL